MSGTRVGQRIEALCRQFRLPTVAAEVVPRLVAADQEPALETLAEVLELEASDRQQRRVDRLRRASKLPLGKMFDTLELERFPAKLQRQLEQLRTARFVGDGVNVLAFGLPGTGKSHGMAALGHELVAQGTPVLFTPTYRLVQELLAAKRDLALPRLLRKLDHFEVIILDDLGDTKQHADEAEVLFTLIAERYERRSLIVTSNVVFSQWEQVFQSQMATAAAIDRIVHHSVILEFDVPSYRTQAAQQRQATPPREAKRRRSGSGRSTQPRA